MVIVEILFVVMAAGVLGCCVFFVFWFLILMVYNFVKIYIITNETRGMTVKELRREEKKRCGHANKRYTENHPDLVWTCNDCGEMVK